MSVCKIGAQMSQNQSISQSATDKFVSDLKEKIKNACHPLDAQLDELETEVKSMQQYTNQVIARIDAQLKTMKDVNYEQHDTHITKV